MKKLALVAALFFSAGLAVAHDGPSGSGNFNSGTAGAVGVGVFVTGGATTSNVNGSFNASLNGAGAQQGQFTAGNQGFATSSVTFGTTQTSTTSSNWTSNGGNPSGGSASSSFSQSTQTGFNVASNSGSENFGSDTLSNSNNGNTIGFNSSENGSAAAGTIGLIGEAGAGFASFDRGSFSGHGHN
jgi:hypothetical protein